MIIFREFIYRYIREHDGETILYKDLMKEFKTTYPTVRNHIKWLINNNFIIKDGKKIFVHPSRK